MTEIARARSALHSLDPGCDRETWVRVGMAAKAAGLDLEDFTTWSSQAANFDGERDCAIVWRSISDGPVKAGTLFSMAFAAGWKDPTKKPRHNGHRTHQVAGRASDINPRRERRPVALSSALDAWQRFEPATVGHGYIVAKQGRPDGLRVVPAEDDLTIAGQRVAGWLVVPVLSLSGELRTLQFIPPPGQGEKRNLPSGRFPDGLFVVGDMAESERIYIVEGIGQAWACWRATGCAAVVSFGTGRMSTVATILRNAYPDRRLIVVPDRDEEHKAASIAKQVRGEWVELPEGKPHNYDANDYAAEYGADELAELLNHTKKPPQRFTLLTAAELSNLPGIRWRVRGAIPFEGIGAIYGPSTCGKSFLALDMLAAIAMGKAWFGCHVKAAPVLYVALEGEAGISNRIQAYQAEHGPLPEAFRFLLTALDIRDKSDSAELVKAIKATGQAGGVLVLDTLNRAAPGMDENDSRDMGEVISAAKAIQADLGGLVLLVHHTGKDGTKGLRGHSSLHAALDCAIEVRRDGDSREWLIAKAKDGQDGEGHPFRLDVVEIGTDDEGEAITSCIVVPQQKAAEATKRRIPKGGNQRIVLNALSELLRKSKHFGKSAAPPTRPCVELEAAITAIAPRLTCEEKRKSERTRQAITGLLARKSIEHREGWLWLP